MSEIKPIFTNEAMLTTAAVNGGAFIVSGKDPSVTGDGPELSPNFGDGLRVQAAAVWDFEDAGLAATSIPSVNLTP